MSSSCLHVDKNQLGRAQSLSEDEWNAGKAHFPSSAPHRLRAIYYFRPLSTRMQRFFNSKINVFFCPRTAFGILFFLEP